MVRVLRFYNVILFSAIGDIWCGGEGGRRGYLIVWLSCRQSWHSFLQNDDAAAAAAAATDDEIRFEL